MMNGDTIFKLNHITKRFSGLVAVNDLSLEMKKRTIHALIGPNEMCIRDRYIGVGISFPILSGLDRNAGIRKKKLNLQRVRNLSLIHIYAGSSPVLGTMLEVCGNSSVGRA